MRVSLAQFHDIQSRDHIKVSRLSPHLPPPSVQLVLPPAEKRQSKYGAESVVVDGIRFDSKKEYSRYTELQLLEKIQMITDLERQVEFELAPACEIDGRNIPPLKYKADFCYFENGKKIVEDSKGFKTPAYRIKRHLMKTVHGIDIKET